MTTQLEDDIRTALAGLADSTTIDSDARFGDRTAHLTELRPTTRRWVMPAAAALVGLALVGALFASMRDTSTTAPVADQVLPAPAESNVDGLFSTDDLDPAIIDGNDSPTIVASAYLDDRTRPEVLPAGFPITYSIDGDSAVTYVPGSLGNQAVVRFELQLPEDSGSGYLLLDQTASINQPKRWVVAGAETTSFGLADLSYEAGVVSASYTSEIGGLTEVTVYDAATGEALAPTVDVMPTEEVHLNRAANEFPAALGRFEFSGIDADAVTVRLWNTNRQDGGSPVAVFAESFVQRDSTRAYDGPSPIADAAAGNAVNAGADEPVFDSEALGAFDGLADGESLLILSDLLSDEPITISLRRDDSARQDSVPAPFCIQIDFSGRMGSACFAASQIGSQSMGFSFESADSSRVLVGSIVPDSVTSITLDHGTIGPMDNVWFDVIDSGATLNYTISNADGSQVARRTLR